MTIRTFWTIFLKIVGLWILVKILYSFMDNIMFMMNLWFAMRSGATVQSSDWYSPVAVVITTIGLCALLVWQIFFNTTWFNDKLRLDKDVDEEKIDMYIPRTTILAVMSMVIGGLVLVDNVPQLATQIFAFMQEKELFRRDPESRYIIPNHAIGIGESAKNGS